MFSSEFRKSTDSFQKVTMSFLPEPRQHENTFGFTAWRGPSTVMSAPHAHNDIEINYCSSQLVYSSAGKTTTLPADTPCAFWGAKPHQLIQIDEGHQLAFVTIPLARFMSWGLPEMVKDRLLRGTVLVGSHDSTSAELAPHFDRWAHDLFQAQPLTRRAAALEVEALVCRMARGSWVETAPASVRSSIDLDRAARMATFIAEHSEVDIRVGEVARSVHLHPNRASSLFRAVFGSSVNTYLGQFRVAEAQRLLLTTDLNSAAVAAKAGFQSLSAYHETFAKICGTTPTRWRKLHADKDVENP
jgi:AraC family transcriptional regulator, melibiose operon regulatory protein